jgi:hypothetical protein
MAILGNQKVAAVLVEAKVGAGRFDYSLTEEQISGGIMVGAGRFPSVGSGQVNCRPSGPHVAL